MLHHHSLKLGLVPMSLGVTVCLASVSGATEPLCMEVTMAHVGGLPPPPLQAKVYGE